ncbi:MAG: TlpA family protein disulfide reductase [Gemmatimonadales bacterium]|nr:MAG: TlpA family protein disulfide reductase [Gemmatimonadales bacterium]
MGVPRVPPFGTGYGYGRVRRTPHRMVHGRPGAHRHLLRSEPRPRPLLHSAVPGRDRGGRGCGAPLRQRPPGRGSGGGPECGRGWTAGHRCHAPLGLGRGVGHLRGGRLGWRHPPPTPPLGRPPHRPGLDPESRWKGRARSGPHRTEGDVMIHIRPMARTRPRGDPALHPRARARRWSGAFLAPALLLLAVACGESQGESPRAAPPIPGNPAPAWEGRTLDGEVVSLEDLRGEVVLLNVWATWCAPCIREMPALDRLERTYRDRGVRVVGASVDRGSAAPQVRRFVEDHDISFLILLDPDQTIMSRFRTLGVPETFLIGPDGIIAHRWIGEFDPMVPSELERIEAQVARLTE